MCYNYTLAKSSEELEAYYNTKWESKDRAFPVSIFPRKHAPILTHRWHNPLHAHTALELIFWGWNARIKGEKTLVPNNRIEKIRSNRAFYGDRADRHRCLIPADSFKEWVRRGEEKSVYKFSMGGELFSLGGFTTLSDWNSGFSVFSMITVPPELQIRDQGPAGVFRPPLIIPIDLVPAWMDIDLKFEAVMKEIEKRGRQKIAAVVA